MNCRVCYKSQIGKRKKLNRGGKIITDLIKNLEAGYAAVLNLVLTRSAYFTVCSEPEKLSRNKKNVKFHEAASFCPTFLPTSKSWRRQLTKIIQFTAKINNKLVDFK